MTEEQNPAVPVAQCSITHRLQVKLRYLLWCIIVGFMAQPSVQADPQPWVLVDVSTHTLSVMRQDRVIEVYHDVRLGRNGYAQNRLLGDGKTPLGEFRVAWINPNSRFRLFFGLDYPGHEHAELAFRRKLIDFDTYYAIRQALTNGDIPPQDTLLGGYIGIHGVGSANPRIHQATDWTDGCIALSDTQLERLAKWIKIGSRIVVIEGNADITPLARNDLPSS